MAACPPRVSAINLNFAQQSSRTTSGPSSPDMHHRPMPSIRLSSSLSASAVSSRVPTPRHSPLLPSASPNYYPPDKYPCASDNYQYQLQQQQREQYQPSICGLPLKYVSLVTLAVQNAALSIVMHYSRVSIPPALAYSPASAVLLNELFKGSISFVIALMRSPLLAQPVTRRNRPFGYLSLYFAAFTDLCGEIFSPDAWKLSIPAILYVVQNSLQFVAISNLPVASFQVTYQMKILTTAAFSVALLRKKLSTTKWLALFFLAIGVGIVQIQTATRVGPGHVVSKEVGSAHEFHVHVMSPLKGFGAVTAACFTSGLAGVYFEMVLKGSKADLWVRNVQLSLFSLIPALLPVLYASRPPNSQGFFLDLFRNFGGWAWATVMIQVFGGLVTAVVIKYSDNILKGFATSLSIVLSFLASVALFDFRITPSFIIGASTVLCATWMYNQPSPASSPSLPSTAPPSALPSPPSSGKEKFSIILNDASPKSSVKSSPSPSPYYPGTPASDSHSLAAQSATVLGNLGVSSFIRRKSGGFGGAGSSRNSSTASLTGLLSSSLSSVGGSNPSAGAGVGTMGGGPGGKGSLGLAESGELTHGPEGLNMMDASPLSSRPPSRASSPGPFARAASGEKWAGSAASSSAS